MADGAGRRAAPQPRADLDAEAAVLSAALLDGGAALEVVDTLEPADFYADANRLIFERIVETVRRDASPDAVTIAAELRAAGTLERIGGTPYIAQLANATPAVAHVRDHCAVIRQLARLRRARNVFGELAAEANAVELGQVDEWFDRAETRAYLATAAKRGVEETAVTYADLALRTYEEIAEAARKREQGADRVWGIATGFRCLDEHLGGLHGGQLVIIAARPGVGKTSLMLQLVESVAQQRFAAIVLSLEMTAGELMGRALARRVGVPARQLREGYPGDWQILSRETERLAKLPIVIDDEPDVTPLRVRAKVRRHYATLRQRFPGIGLGAVFVDYLQLMDPDQGEARRSENRAVEIGRMTRALKRMAKELDVPVVALSQLRRTEHNAKIRPPQLEDLRDSGCIEQDADVVLFIHREDVYRPPEEWTHGAELIVGKARGEATGVHRVRWDGPRTSFYEEQGALQW